MHWSNAILKEHCSFVIEYTCSFGIEYNSEWASIRFLWFTKFSRQHWQWICFQLKIIFCAIYCSEILPDWVLIVHTGCRCLLTCKIKPDLLYVHCELYSVPHIHLMYTNISCCNNLPYYRAMRHKLVSSKGILQALVTCKWAKLLAEFRVEEFLRNHSQRSKEDLISSGSLDSCY